jgi:ElaB/YqjD/DUF883 family membrane-anchored ribosome-binding protein
VQYLLIGVAVVDVDQARPFARAYDGFTNKGDAMGDYVSSEKLMQDMRAVVVDAEELLKATAGQTGERIDKVRARAEESLRVARGQLKEAGEAVDDTVRQHPWATAGIAAGVGVLVGMLLARR